MSYTDLSEFEKKEIKKAKFINYTVFGVFVVLIAVAFLWFCSNKYWHSFSCEKWEQYPERRAKMTADLFENYTLVGMTEAEIVDLLGPNNNDYGYFNKENRYVYYLGEERTIIDSEWLLLDFENGVVKAYYMRTD